MICKEAPGNEKVSAEIFFRGGGITKEEILSKEIYS